MSRDEMLLQLTLEMLRTSGVRAWESPEVRAAIVAAATDIVDGFYGPDMALPDYFKISSGTALTIKASGGNAAITLASLANGNGTTAGARQAATLDLGANWARAWLLVVNFELAAPTAGNVINLYGSWHTATGAGQGNTSGSDAAYTGYSSNIDASVKHLELLGVHVCTSQATTTVQKGTLGLVFPKGQYLNAVVDNRSGAGFHSTDTNQVITLIPLEESIEDTL